MGLTIHYRLHASQRTPAAAQQLVQALRQRALDLPFADVGELVEINRPVQPSQLDRDDPHRWLVCQSESKLEINGHYLRVPPTYLLAFVTNPGDGCEAANFGLCRYPASVQVNDHQGRLRRLKTGHDPKAWYWASFCKTQYASNPQFGGVSHFLKCHLLVVTLLDRARELGILETVCDEGNYWEHRDAERLTREVGQWNQMIAAFVGKLKDQLGGQMEAPITDFPNFEHLEADGQAQ